MHLKFSIYYVIACLSLSELKPLRTISEDMGIILQCNRTFPVSKLSLNLALVENRFETKVTEKFKCFLHCIYQGYEWMDAEGNFRLDIMKDTLSESTLDDLDIIYLMQTCADTGNEDKCEKAFKFTRCFWSESVQLTH